MSRQLFSRWSSGLSAGGFARAIAAVGLLREPFRPGETDIDAILTTEFKQDTGLLTIRAESLCKFAADHHNHADFERKAVPAADYLKLWQTVRARIQANPRALLRLVIIPFTAEDEHPWFSLHWLAAQLSHAEVGASSVCVYRYKPEFDFGWDWPMRIGVLAGKESEALLPLLKKRPWSHLFELVMADRGARECDLLLLDADLRTALQQVLTRPRRLSADCTVVLGEMGVAGSRQARLVSTLRAEARTSGLAVTGIERAKREKWLESLLREISHNAPLDVALWRAAEAAGAPRPYIEASPNLLRFARLAVTASRMSDHLQALGNVRAPQPSQAENNLSRGAMAAPPADIADLGEKIAEISRNGAFAGESHDATAIVDLKMRAEARMGSPVRFAKKNGAPAPTLAPKAVPEERRVNYDLFDLAQPDSAPLVDKPLSREQRYRLDIYIGFLRQVGGTADAAVPIDKLPPSASGHDLSVFFCPLTRDERGELPEPQTGKIFLPPQGDSGKCSFAFDTFALSERFHARVIVAHRNRIVQTLIFSAGIAQGSKTVALVKLSVETATATDLNTLAYRSRVDASLVVNHSPEGHAGATALSGGEVRYVELPQTEKIVENIRGVLNKLAARKEPYKKLDDKEMRILLFRLATYGKLIWSEIGPDARKLLGDAGALQVVDARPGAYLPIEFFFSSELPAQATKICPKAPEFLKDSEKPHKECPHHADENFQCPLRFWGFQRVIERQAVYATDEGLGAFRLRSPRPERTRIDALSSVLFAASDRVDKADLANLEDVLKSAGVKNLQHVGSWKEWRQAVQKQSPTLLLLLPHSDHPEGFDDIEALEIGSGLLPLPSLTAADIAGPDSPHPVVFLLGCSTNLTQLPFANFVSYVRKLDASLVVGTLSPVSGRRAAAFLTEMVPALRGGNASFGETFLKVRRNLLASGNGFALTLVSYGDVDWTV